MTKNTHNSTFNISTEKSRLSIIDMMIGTAMVLVVVGHMSVGFEPQWYSRGLHLWIYSFHMELFVFLSAFLIRYAYKGVDSISAYGKYVWRKFLKLFLWFLILGMGVSLLACVVKGYPLNGKYIWDSLSTLLIYPRWSETAFLWYIYVLFGYYLVSPLIFKLPQWGRALLCVGAMLLTMVPGDTFMCSHDFCQYTLFYFLGILSAEWIEEIRGMKTWSLVIFSLPFLAWTVWIFTQGYSINVQMWQLGWWTTVTGVASIPFFYLLSKLFVKIKPVFAALTAISKNCYVIYLLQMFVIWGCTWIMMKSGLHEKNIFVLFLIVTSLLALVLPILFMHIVKSIKKAGGHTGHPAKNTSLK